MSATKNWCVDCYKNVQKYTPATKLNDEDPVCDRCDQAREKADGSSSVNIYCWREGTKPEGVRVQAAGEVLDAIRRKHGQLEPEFVVKESRPKNAPLHGYFEWDNAKAAENFRIEQARFLIKNIVIVAEKNAPAPALRAIVRTESREELHGGTNNNLEVIGPRTATLLRATREIREWRAKYGTFIEFASVVASIDALGAKNGEAERGMATPGYARQRQAAQGAASKAR